MLPRCTRRLALYGATVWTACIKMCIGMKFSKRSAWASQDHGVGRHSRSTLSHGVAGNKLGWLNDKEFDTVALYAYHLHARGLSCTAIE